MNTDQANKLPLPEIVEKIGGKFDYKDARGSLWYNSPLRDDAKPSFHISEVDHPKLGRIWIWKDFGDEGGKVVDLLIRKYGVDVSGALSMLNGWGYGNYRAKVAPRPAPLLDLIGWQEKREQGAETTPIQEPQKAESSASAFEDVRVEDLDNRALKGYLYGRGIDFWIARPYVKEIHYTSNSKPFFALAFKNDADDYELRNPYYQGVYGKKAITTLHRDKMQEGGTVLIFEGFMDFLSALVWYGTKPRSTVIVLNSVEMKHEAVKAILEMKAGSVEAYPDNDEAGRKLMAYLRENLPGVYIEDKSGLYADSGYKDFNDLVKAEKSQVQKQASR